MCFDNFMNLVKDINAHCNIIYILFLIVLLITGLRWLGWTKLAKKQVDIHTVRMVI
jgi:hypothetical protein